MSIGWVIIIVMTTLAVGIPIGSAMGKSHAETTLWCHVECDLPVVVKGRLYWLVSDAEHAEPTAGPAKTSYGVRCAPPEEDRP